jgi:hypothetical protein
LTVAAFSAEIRISVLTRSGEPAAGALLQIFPGRPGPDDGREPIKPPQPRSDGVVGFETSADGSVVLDLSPGKYTVFAFSKRDAHRFALLGELNLSDRPSALTLSAREATEVTVEAVTESGSPADASEIFFRPCKQARGNIGFIGNDGRLRCYVSPGTYNVVLASSFHYLYLVLPAVRVKGDRMTIRFDPSSIPTAKVSFDMPPGSFPAIYEVLQTDHTYEIVPAIEETVGYDAAYTKVYALITPQIPVTLSGGLRYSISLSYVVARKGESFAYEIRPPEAVLNPGEYRMGNTGREPFKLQVEPNNPSYRPGDEVILSFRITDTRGNRMTRAFNFSSARLIFPYAVVRDPEGRIIADNRFEIVNDPIPERFFWFTFSLPSTAISGRYTVETTMECGIYGDLRDMAHFEVIRPTAEVRVKSLRIPSEVEVGDPFEVMAQIVSASRIASARLSFARNGSSLSFEGERVDDLGIIWKPSLPQAGTWSWRIEIADDDGDLTLRDGEILAKDTTPPRLTLQVPLQAEWGMPLEIRLLVEENDSLERAWLEISRGKGGEPKRITDFGLRTSDFGLWTLIFHLPSSQAHPPLSLRAFVRDRSGNSSATDRVQIGFLDTTPPQISDLRAFEIDGKIRFEAFVSDNRSLGEVKLLVEGMKPIRMDDVDGIYHADLIAARPVRYAVEAADLPDESGDVRRARFPSSGYLLYTPKRPIEVRISPSSPEPIVIRAGERMKFEARVLDEDGLTLDVPVRWFTSGGVGMIAEDGGLWAVRAVEPPGREGEVGAVALRPNPQGQPVIGRVRVRVIPSEPDHISLLPRSIHTFSGEKTPILVTFFDRFGNEVNPNLSGLRLWVEPSELGRIEGGFFVADRAGLGRIEARYGDLRTSVPVKVHPGRVIEMRIIPREATLRSSQGAEFRAKGFDAVGNEIEVHPLWVVYGGVGEIDGEGWFKGTRAGVGRVVAYLGEVSAEAEVEVKPGDLARLTLEPYVEYLPLSRPDQIRRKLFLPFGWDSSWNPVPVGKLRWQTDPLAGTVDDGGLFTATDQTGGAAVGGVVINGSVFAFAPGVFAKSVVVIQLNPPGPISRLELTPEGFPSKPESLILSVGERVDLEVTGFDPQGNRMSVVPSWRVTGGIGYIMGECTFVASKPGQGSVIASALGYSDSISVEVTPGKLARISAVPHYVELRPGETIRFAARGYDPFGNLIPLDRPRWSVPEGRFEAKRPGYHVVGVESDGVRGYAQVYVRNGKLAELRIIPSGPIRLRAGEAVRFSVEGYDAAGNPITVIPGWRVEGNVGKVSLDGTFLPVRAGRGKVVAYQEGVETSVEVEVSPGDPVELCISPPFTWTIGNEEIRFVAYAMDRMGNEMKVDPTWGCSRDLGEISGDGVLRVNPEASGGYVVARFEGLSATAIVELGRGGTLTSLILLPENSSITPYSSQRFLELGLDGGGIFPIRTASPTGVIRPEAPGADSITTAIGGVEAQANLSVYDEIALIEPISGTCYGLSGMRMKGVQISSIEGDEFGYVIASTSRGARMIVGYEVEHKGRDGVGFQNEPEILADMVPKGPVRMEITPRYVLLRSGEGSSLKFVVHLYDSLDNLVPDRADIRWFLVGDIGEINQDGFLNLRSGLKDRMEGEVIAVAPKLNLSARARVKIEEKDPISSVRVEPQSSWIIRGQTMRFSAIGIDPYGKALPISPLWELLDESRKRVEGISQSGVVSTDRFEIGQTLHVRASVQRPGGTVWGEASLRIISGPPIQIRVQPSSLSLRIGESAELTASGYDELGNPTSLPWVKWEVSGDVCTIEGRPGDKAIIRGNHEGKGLIIARSNGIYGSAEVEVEAESALNLFWPEEPELGDRDNPIVVEAGRVIRLRTSPPGSAYLSLEGGEGTILPDNGIFIAKAGSYRVVASRDGMRDELNLIVLPASLSRISVSPPSASLRPSERIRFSAEGFDRFGNRIPDLSVLWEVAGGGEIDQTGLFKAGSSEGIGQVTARAGNVVGIATVSVVMEIGEPVRLSVKVEPQEIPAGGRAEVKVIGIDRNGNIVTEGLKDVSLLIAPNIGEVRRVSEDVWGYTAPRKLEAEEITFTAEFGKIRAEAKAKLVPANLARIDLELSSMKLKAGDQVEIIAKGFDPFGNPIRISPSWSLSDSLGVIEGSGDRIRYLARRVGKETIRTSQSGLSGEVRVTISPGEPIKLTLEPDSVRVQAGERLRIKATASDRFDNRITSIQVSWEVKGTDAELKPMGMEADFIARRSGVAWVTVKYGQLKSTARIEVVPGKLRGIRFYLSPDRGKPITQLKAASGQRYLILASGVDELGNEIKLDAVKWEIRGDVGEISAQGDLATLLATFIGDGRISASSGGVSAELPVHVEPERIVIGREGGRLECAEMELIIPPGATEKSLEITLSIAAPFGFREGEETLSRVYRIEPKGTILRKPLLIKISPIQRIVGESGASPAFWDDFHGRWIRLAGRRFEDGSVGISVNHLGTFALISGEIAQVRGDLRIERVEIWPNPFYAPDVNRLAIGYHLRTPDGGPADVTIRLIGMNGPVTTILKDASKPPGYNVEMWDGRDEGGHLVRNGRYFLIIIASHAGKVVSARRVVVVFK